METNIEISHSSAGPIKALFQAISWMAFPLAPVLLAQAFYQLFNITGSDPREWPTVSWFILLGPLCGFGFLAGATVGLADDKTKHGLRGWLSRSALWVGVGPWLGFVVVVASYYSWQGAGWLVERLIGPVHWQVPLSADSLWAEVLFWTVIVGSSYGWLIVAIAALRRARRSGRLWAAVRRGLVTALAFVGSLIGSFWAATEVWRSYFFDKTMPKLVILAFLSASMLSGCGNNPTVGDMRRRELFGAMISAWVLGLALAWRWWARARSKPPGR
jgi:hypothetical protein